MFIVNPFVLELQASPLASRRFYVGYIQNVLNYSLGFFGATYLSTNLSFHFKNIKWVWFQCSKRFFLLNKKASH